MNAACSTYPFLLCTLTRPRCFPSLCVGCVGSISTPWAEKSPTLLHLLLGCLRFGALIRATLEITLFYCSRTPASRTASTHRFGLTQAPGGCLQERRRSMSRLVLCDSTACAAWHAAALAQVLSLRCVSRARFCISCYCLHLRCARRTQQATKQDNPDRNSSRCIMCTFWLYGDVSCPYMKWRWIEVRYKSIIIYLL